MQSAIGRIQLSRMADWTAIRQGYGAQLDQGVKGCNLIRLIEVPVHMSHAEYKHYMFIKPECLAEGWSRDKIVNEIVSKGVPCFQGSCSEVYLEKAFDDTGLRPRSRLVNAKELGETSLMFLVHPTLTQLEINKAVKVINLVILAASKC